jgi:hypothetical protein
MPNLMNPLIQSLLQQFQPFFFFDPSEKFFPAAAEEFLNQQATESWSSSTTHQRGSAVLLVPTNSFGMGDLSAQSQFGWTDPNGTPLSFSPSDFSGTAPTVAGYAPDPHGNTAVELFVDCAGWTDTASLAAANAPADYTTGDSKYLQQLFSGLANGMNPSIPVTPPSPAPNFSNLTQLTTPTIYAEFDWAGIYPTQDQTRVTSVGDGSDFPQPIGATMPTRFAGLDDYIVLTYYLFYPALTPPPSPATPDSSERFREGQWEAVSVFLKSQPTDARDTNGRPDFNVTLDANGGLTSAGTTAPRFLVYSSGYSSGEDNFTSLNSTVQFWPGAGPSAAALTQSTHPSVFVTAGTHRNLFNPNIRVVVTGGSPGTPAITNSGRNSEITTANAMMSGAVGAAITCGALMDVLGPVAIACFILSAVIGVIGLILLAVAESESPTEGGTPATPGTPQPPTDVASATGPSATSASSTGGPKLRLISQYDFDPTPPITTYPLPQAGSQPQIEMPTWWDYPGRWGVAVNRAMAGNWDSGTRRTDPFHRSRAYWNAWNLVQQVQLSQVGQGSLPAGTTL